MFFNSKFLTAAKLPQHHSTNFKGLGIVIEWPKGSVRVGEDKNGKKWHRKMEADYGYIPDTTAAGDKEGLDVYIGPDEASDKVYVVEQLKEDGEFDEYKVLMGFPDLDTAYDTYLKHYPDDWDETRVGGVSEVPFDYAFDVIEDHQDEQQEKTASTVLPRFLYHGSPKVYSEDNLKNGLRKRNSVSHNEWEGGAIYLALDSGAAAMYPDHWETGESGHGNVVYRVETKYLNKSLLRPDDADFPDMFANLTEAEMAELSEKFGEDFDEDNWAFCEWPVSLYLTGQVAYLGDIPPEALSITDTNRTNRAVAHVAAELDPSFERLFNPTHGMKNPPVEGYVWISPGRNEDYILKGRGTDHWKFMDQQQMNGRPLNYKQYDESPRGYAEVKNDSKTVILSLSPNVKWSYQFIPDSVVREFKQKFPGYKIYKNDGKTAGLAYLKALMRMQ